MMIHPTEHILTTSEDFHISSKLDKVTETYYKDFFSNSDDIDEDGI